MPTILFYLFAILAISGAIALVAFRNPVSSALSMVVAFIGLAVLFIGLNAYFVGIIQILVYAGAIMVLFLFIIMLLDLKKEEGRRFSNTALIAGIILPLLLIVQIYAVIETNKKTKEPYAELNFKAAAAANEQNPSIKNSLDKGQLPDTNLIGHQLFGSQNGAGFNFPIQLIGILLLIATVGCITLSKRPDKSNSRIAAKDHPYVGSGNSDTTPVSEKMADIRKPRSTPTDSETQT